MKSLSILVVYLVVLIGTVANQQEKDIAIAESNAQSIVHQMRVLVCIAAYRSIGNEYLLQALSHYRELCMRGYLVQIVVHTVDRWDKDNIDELHRSLNCPSRYRSDNNATEDDDNNDLSILFEYFDVSIALDLTGMHRKTIKRYIDYFDYFVYSEDDIMITADVFQIFQSYTTRSEASTLSFGATIDGKLTGETSSASMVPFIVGYTRYETLAYPTTYAFNGSSIEHEANSKFIIENPLQFYRLICIEDEPYLLDYLNPHQASWIMTRQQVLQLADQCSFLDQWNITLHEQRGKMVYMSTFSLFKADDRVPKMCGIQAGIGCEVNKVIPAQAYCDLAVHHARQRYAADTPIFTMGDMLAGALDFARDQDNWASGDVPLCWQRAIETSEIKEC